VTAPLGPRALLSPPHRRRMIFSAVFGLVVGVAAWFFGVDLPHAIGLGAAIGALSACIALVGDQPRVEWARPAAEARDGARRDVVQLGWALQSRRRGVAPEAVRRLRFLTQQVLELHGLELETEAHRSEIERILPPAVLSTIRRGAESPTTSMYEGALRELERLASAPPGRLPSAQEARPEKEKNDAR
jgi:hypothetical protein